MVTLRVAQSPTVPRLVKLDVVAARAALEKAGLRASERTVPSREPPGTVLRQAPSPGTRVLVDSKVQLEVASPPVGAPKLPGRKTDPAGSSSSAARKTPGV